MGLGKIVKTEYLIVLSREPFDMLQINALALLIVFQKSRERSEKRQLHLFHGMSFVFGLLFRGWRCAFILYINPVQKPRYSGVLVMVRLF